MNDNVIANYDLFHQLESLLTSVSESDYQTIEHSVFFGSIGQHLRHSFDMFWAIKNTLDADRYPIQIDYDYHRRRGHDIETNKEVALTESVAIRCWLVTIDQAQLEASVGIVVEDSLSDKDSESHISTLSRELCFAGSHLVHHLAMMAAIARVLGYDIDRGIGLAPATARFMRQQACAR